MDQEGVNKRRLNNNESSTNTEQPAPEPEHPTNAGNANFDFHNFRERIKRNFRKLVSKAGKHSKDLNEPDTKQTKNGCGSKRSKLNSFLKLFYDKFKKSRKPKNQQMTPEEEAIAITLTNELFSTMTSNLAPALRDFLDSKNLIKRSSTIDAYLYMKTLIKTYKRNSQLFATSDETSQSKMLQKAMNGRNAICHGDLHDILSEWEAFLTSWIKVSILMNNPTSADEIGKVLDNLRIMMNNNNGNKPPDEN